MEFKCEVCEYRTKDGAQATKHRKDTGHSYRILKQIALDLSDENAARVAKVYGKQIEFAEKVFSACYGPIRGETDLSRWKGSIIYQAILQAVLTPAIYIEEAE